MKRAAALAALLALAACGGGDEPPNVDWTQVPTNQRAAIEDAVDAGDCTKMQTYFDSSEDTDVLKHLDWHLRSAGCYE